MSEVNDSRPVDMRVLQHLGETGLEERRLPGDEQFDLGAVDVDADDVMAELGHARGVDGAEVAASDHGHLRH